MSLTIYNIRKWFMMMTGKSIYHVRQGVGKCYSLECVRGYYNDLTAKVTGLPALLSKDALPKFKTSTNLLVDFPVEIIQYGLGAYDLYLQTHESCYRQKFLQCVDFAMTKQNADGSWNNFFFIYPNHPFGAMVQGEGASLLVRAYEETHDDAYLQAAKRALDFMLKPVEQGGTTAYYAVGPVLLEYTHKPAVLNGWIFAWWGLFDYVLVTKDCGYYQQTMNQSCEAMMAMMPRFTNSFWSMYDADGHLASSHYQTIHVAQMKVMYALTGQRVFETYAKKWEHYQANSLYRVLSFCIKAYQKIIE